MVRWKLPSMIHSPDAAKNFFFTVDGAFALLAIVTAISIQLESLPDSSGCLQESSREYVHLQETYLPRENNMSIHSAFPLL